MRSWRSKSALDGRLARCRRTDGEELLAHDRVPVRLCAGSRPDDAGTVFRTALSRSAESARVHRRAAPARRRRTGGGSGGCWFERWRDHAADRRGRARPPPEQKPRGVLSSASEGYAAALGLRVVKGRWLTDHEPTPVFVINETLARQAFPGGDPIGKRIRLPFVDASTSFAPGGRGRRGSAVFEAGRRN